MCICRSLRLIAVTFDVIAADYTFIESMVYSIGVAIRYMLAMVLFAGLRERIDIAPIPKYLKGTPILFIAAALLSLAFGGFAGMI